MPANITTLTLINRQAQVKRSGLVKNMLNTVTQHLLESLGAASVTEHIT